MSSFRFAAIDEEEDWLDELIDKTDRSVCDETSQCSTSKVNPKAAKKRRTKTQLEVTSVKTKSDGINKGEDSEEPPAEDVDSSWINLDSYEDDNVDEESNKKPNFNFPPCYDEIPHRLSKEKEETRVEIPALINRYLRDYQRDGVEFLYSHYVLNRGALLADDMGLGKTIQIIAFLAAVQRKVGTNVDLLQLRPPMLRKIDDEISGEENSDVYARKPSLIVAPACVLCNWLHEFNNWGHFAVGKFHGNTKEDTLFKLRRNRLDVVVTTFETFRESLEILNSFDFDCVFVDEVHKIKEPTSQLTKALKSLHCMKRFGLTGTPMQNNVLELWCILDWANPNCLGSREEFRLKFADLIEQGQRYSLVKRRLAVSKRRCEAFGKLRDKWMLRRTKSLIASQLPKKEDFVLFCPITDLQSEIYGSILKSNDVQLVLSQYEVCDCGGRKKKRNCCYEENEKGVKVKSLTLPLLQILLKAANHIGLFSPIEISNEIQKDAVYSAKDVYNLAFANCAELKTLSPTKCHAKLLEIEHSGKMAMLEHLLKNFKQNNDKVLLFSYSVRILEILERFVLEKSYTFRKITGQTKPDDRVSFVAEFNKDPKIFIFLISTKAGGVGLNITGANRVVIFDPNWNPSHDLQAQDRAYRIGQIRDVEVYRFVTVGTVEEIIYLRQVLKQNVGSSAVQSENCKRIFNKEDVFGLRKLFELRFDKPCLMERLLSRYANIQKKFTDFTVIDYEKNLDDFSQEKLVEEILLPVKKFFLNDFNVFEDDEEEINSDDDEHGLGYTLNQFTPDSSVRKTTKCDEIFGAAFVHKNKNLVGDDMYEKHMAACASKDVYELHQHSQELAHEFCPPVKKSFLEKKKPPSRQIFCRNSLNVVVGCTPVGVKRALFAALARSLNCSEVELAKNVSQMSERQRIAVLRDFYAEKLPDDVLNEIFPVPQKNNNSTKVDKKKTSTERIFHEPSTSANDVIFVSKPEKEIESNYDNNNTSIDVLDNLVDCNLINIRHCPPSSTISSHPLSETTPPPVGRKISLLDDLFDL